MDKERKASMMKRFKKNEIGNDFIVGDIHGCFSKLENALAKIGFNPECDRLFSVGDMVDRGDESERTLEFLASPWFHSVRGNHEQMAIDDARKGNDPNWYASNGGAWFMALPDEKKQKFADIFDELPFAIEVETDRGLIGIVHADCPFSSWASFRRALHDAKNTNALQICMWDRTRIDHQMENGIHDLFALIVGHIPFEKPVRLGNVFYIDTGAVFGHDMVIIDFNELPE